MTRKPSLPSTPDQLRPWANRRPQGLLILSALALALGACPSESSTQATGASPAAAAAAAGAATRPSPAAEPAPKAEAPAEASTPEAKASALEIYTQRCVACHGALGAGDGPAAAALNPKPASFATAAWQAKVTDKHIEEVILHGGPKVGMSPLMPGNPDLADKPEVVRALREYVRSLKK